MACFRLVTWEYLKNTRFKQGPWWAASTISPSRFAVFGFVDGKQLQVALLALAFGPAHGWLCTEAMCLGSSMHTSAQLVLLRPRLLLGQRRLRPRLRSGSTSRLWLRLRLRLRLRQQLRLRFHAGGRQRPPAGAAVYAGAAAGAAPPAGARMRRPWESRARPPTTRRRQQEHGTRGAGRADLPPHLAGLTARRRRTQKGKDAEAEHSSAACWRSAATSTTSPRSRRRASSRRRPIRTPSRAHPCPSPAQRLGALSRGQRLTRLPAATSGWKSWHREADAGSSWARWWSRPSSCGATRKE